MREVTIGELTRRARTAVEVYPQMKREEAEALSPEVTLLNREQMMEGVTAQERPIAPAYSPYTQRLKRLAGQPSDRVTLFSTGAFQEGMFTKVEGDRLVTGSTDSKTDDLTAKYGESIFGLTDANADRLKRRSIELLLAKIRDILKV